MTSDTTSRNTPERMDLPFVGPGSFARQPARRDWDRLDGANPPSPPARRFSRGSAASATPSSAFSKLCALDNGNDGCFVITNGTKIQGIFTDQHQATRLDKSNVKACPEDGRGPHLNTAPKLLDWHAAANAFDQEISPRNLVRSSNRSGLASEAAGDLAVQSGRDERFFLHNGIVHDIRNVLQALLSGLWVAQDRIREGRAGEVPEILGEN
jgi:hypothetical protein